jgi:hypothetical protein
MIIIWFGPLTLNNHVLRGGAVAGSRLSGSGLATITSLRPQWRHMSLELGAAALVFQWRRPPWSFG